VEVEKQLPRRKTTELSKIIGKTFSYIRRSNPDQADRWSNHFHDIDEEATVQCAAFEKAGERAYPR